MLALAFTAIPRALAEVVTGVQRGDSPRFARILAGIRVARPGGDPPRTCPDLVVADRACTSAAGRAHPRRPSIPSKGGPDAHRKAKGPKGGRPPAFDPASRYRLRHAVEYDVSLLKRNRGMATRYDKLAVRYEAVVLIAAINEWLSAS